MNLPEIDDAIRECKEHLGNTNSFGTQIEAFLTQYVLIRVCARFEEFIKDALVSRAAIANDPYVASLVRSASSYLVRDLKTSGIKGLLRGVAPECGAAFAAAVDNTRAETYFNNIVTNRHSTAHGSGTKVTFLELEEFYREALKVLDAFQTALFPTPNSP